MNMKNVIKMLAVAGLMSAGVAQAAVPADFSAIPGVLFVNWHASAAMAGKSNPMLDLVAQLAQSQLQALAAQLAQQGATESRAQPV